MEKVYHSKSETLMFWKTFVNLHIFRWIGHIIPKHFQYFKIVKFLDLQEYSLKHLFDRIKKVVFDFNYDTKFHVRSNFRGFKFYRFWQLTILGLLRHYRRIVSFLIKLFAKQLILARYVLSIVYGIITSPIF